MSVLLRAMGTGFNMLLLWPQSGRGVVESNPGSTCRLRLSWSTLAVWPGATSLLMTAQFRYMLIWNLEQVYLLSQLLAWIQVF